MTRKKIAAFSASAAILAAMALFLMYPARYSSCVKEGVSVWAVSVLPATFPFLFLTALFTKSALFYKLSVALTPLSNRVMRISGRGSCTALLAMLSGYPVGARSISGLVRRGELHESEVFRLACLASTAGPMFLVGVVGSAMFSSPAAGWALLGAHLAAVIGVCMLLGIGKTPPPRIVLLQNTEENPLFESLYSSVVAILCVGGSIAVFYAFGKMVSDVFSFLPLSDTGWGIVSGLLEMTSGCAALSKIPSPLSLPLCAFLVTFGGACVLMQQLAFLAGTGVKTLPFLGVKLLQGVIAGGLCYLFSLLL